MKRLDIGIASYGKDTAKLARTLESIKQNTVSDWRCFVIHNPSEGDAFVREAIAGAADRDPRFVPVWMAANVGYVGAVNHLLSCAESEYIAYCDNDIEICTPGWDEQLCSLLESNPECGWAFPGRGHYGFFNGRYHECLWNAGYCWILKRAVLEKLRESDIRHRLVSLTDCGRLDTFLGHHEEVDLMVRLRLAGFEIGCCPEVQVLHHESSTQSPESAKRIHRGVVTWMVKWSRYFCGDILKYPNPDPDSGEGYDPRTLRYTDWPPCALYIERMTLHYFPEWNSNPRTVEVPGVGEMDVIEVLKPKGCYRGRAI